MLKADDDGRSGLEAAAEGKTHLIVGIGASAGGLGAFRSFFEALPSDTGMAFVLVQHLDPTYKSALAEIIGQFTGMPVVTASDGTVAAPNTVSVIPPNAILKIEGGVLRLATPETTAARRSSVDTFLVSLAHDQGERAVGVILSGFGSDGTIGIAAIKEAGGLTLSEAEFDHHAKMGMPQSAAAGGFVDSVLQPHEMPERLLEHQRFRSGVDVEEATARSTTERVGHLTTICAVIHSRLGRDFSQYKTSTLMRRVRRRMQALHVHDVETYIDQLRKLPEEPERLFREILIGVTRFFRDPSVFEVLGETILPELLRGAGADPVRVWVAGCATGEEAYSIAILFREAALRIESPRRITIFATDIDDRAIAFARAGIYSDAIEGDLTAARLERDFIKEGQRYRVAKHIREMCVFSVHDLVKDPSFSKLDMITCRNLLIYFESALQQRAISTFHYGLKPDGVLWLGPSETISGSAKFFKAADKKRRIFRRQQVVAAVPKPAPRQQGGSRAAPPPDSGTGLDDQAARMIALYAPAYIIVNGQHDIQRFSGPVAKFLGPVTGSASFNLFRMLHPDLRGPCRALIRKVLEGHARAQEPVTFRNGETVELLNLIAEPMTEVSGGERCLLLVFQELPQISASLAHLSQDVSGASDNNELIAAREQLQTISEELETANEELQSSNEEFQSVNEELHSTVEELETSKEELQSINEELQIVNAELGSRADSLARSNSDLANLFNSTSIAILFLDSQTRIRRFTPAITDIFNVREGDEGRPLSDIASRLVDADLRQDVAVVLRDLGLLEREVVSEDGQSTYLLRVRPYRDLSNVIDGVVVTLVDISETKRLGRDRAQLAAIVESSEDGIIGHDLDGRITSWNAGATKIFGYRREAAIGETMSMLLGHTQVDDWPSQLLKLRNGQPITNLDVSRENNLGRRIDVSLTISPIRDQAGSIVGASAVARDISERKAADDRTKMLMAELDHRVKNILAVVSSVVTQTLKAGPNIEVARQDIEGRIMAISQAHSLLAGPGGVEGSLSALVATELSPYEHVGNVTVRGEDVSLSSKASLIVALAIHELATNAAKYGALSSSEGHLSVSWRTVEVDAEKALELSWIESDGPPVSTPSHRGFGTRLIELSLARGLGATVKREFLPSGLDCQILLPFSEDVGPIRVSHDVKVGSP